MDGLRGTSPAKNTTAVDSPEQLLESFRAAALSVTKLYKTSAAAQSKARSDGYQDCLEDLLVFLDKQNIGLSDGEGWQIRRWATERFDGKDGIGQSIESEDEVEKNDGTQSPDIHQSSTTTINNNNSNTSQPVESDGKTDATPVPMEQSDVSSATPLHQITVPTQDNFTFQSTMTYPQDSDLSIANLNLSDTRTGSTASAQHHPASHTIRSRNNRALSRSRTSNQLGRGAGQKRKINIAEIFDLGSIGGKDVFGGNGGGKRSRHA
ncbi:hypothetical protein BX600DRAFT_510046 [Xylariales sp. PMI_506]|nr:hypothetical protein BX600DRAFT_510046 [Xylariales sp. PMI_506]